MRIIQRSLDTHNSEHVMLWAACCLGFFGFLRAGEFMVNSTFDPSIHLTVQDSQVHVEVNPSSLYVCIKVARYSFSGPIAPKFEHKLRRHKESFGKIATTVVLDKDENLL